MQLCGEQVYFADMRGSRECFHFSTAHLEINLEHQVLAVTRTRDARSLLRWGSAQKGPNPTACGSGRRSTSPLSPAAPRPAALIIDLMS